MTPISDRFGARKRPVLLAAGDHPEGLNRKAGKSGKVTGPELPELPGLVQVWSLTRHTH
jgi:hypothetical protein